MGNSNEYMAQYMAERYRRRHDAYIVQLGGKCVRCGSTDDLEFDHIDPSEKSFSVGDRMAGMAKRKLDAEILKCQLLCTDCHRPKTIADAGKKPWQHGTISGYRYCRCERCKYAKSAHTKAAKAKKDDEHARVARLVELAAHNG